MNKLMEHWYSYAMILLWLLMYTICQRNDLVSRLANKGLSETDGEYYRFITALIIHSSFFHLLVNASAMYFVGVYLESNINSAKLLVFSFLIGVITEILFASIYKDSVSMGGSPIVFALIGLIAALNIMKADDFRFQLGTWYGNWILGYTILANIPLFSDNFVSTLLIHGLPFGLGVLLGTASIIMNWL